MCVCVLTIYACSSMSGVLGSDRILFGKYRVYSKPMTIFTYIHRCILYTLYTRDMCVTWQKIFCVDVDRVLFVKAEIYGLPFTMFSLTTSSQGVSPLNRMANGKIHRNILTYTEAYVIQFFDFHRKHFRATFSVGN